MTNSGRHRWSYLLAAALAVPAAFAQFTTRLEPPTIAAFDRYAQDLEKQLSAHWQGQRSFLVIDDVPSERKNVLAGNLLIRPAVPGNPIAISDGLIHDWIGAVFIPNAPMQKVLAVLQDFDDHAQIYPEVLNSRLVRRSGNDLLGYWRLQRKQQLIPVAFDVEQEAHYREIMPGKWICRAYANRISEVDYPGTSREKILLPGDGQGLLWRLYAYWSLETLNDGVLAECRTLSLSRSIPVALGWVVKPFVQSLPRESLESILTNTRSAVITK